MEPPEKLRLRRPSLNPASAELGLADAGGDAGRALSSLRRGLTLLGTSGIDEPATAGTFSVSRGAMFSDESRGSSSIVAIIGSPCRAVTLGGTDKPDVGADERLGLCYGTSLSNCLHLERKGYLT